MPSFALVALQMIALAVVVWRWDAARWHAGAWFPLVAAAIIGIWTLAHNRPGNFSVFPEPRPAARLVVTGPYAHVRHPMYSAVLLLALGFAIGWTRPLHWIAFGLLAAILFAKALREERLLRARFPNYAEYAARTRRFVPWLL